MNIFRETGRPNAGLVSSGVGGQSNGLVVTGVTDKHIVICDIVSENNGSLGTAINGGSLVAYLAGGSSNLSSPIKVAKGASLYVNSSAGNVTISYYLEG
jgi:hypothetical protein